MFFRSLFPLFLFVSLFFCLCPRGVVSYVSSDSVYTTTPLFSLNGSQILSVSVSSTDALANDTIDCYQIPIRRPCKSINYAITNSLAYLKNTTLNVNRLIALNVSVQPGTHIVNPQALQATATHPAIANGNIYQIPITIACNGTMGSCTLDGNLQGPMFTLDTNNFLFNGAEPISYVRLSRFILIKGQSSRVGGVWITGNYKISRSRVISGSLGARVFLEELAFNELWGNSCSGALCLSGAGLPTVAPWNLTNTFSPSAVIVRSCSFSKNAKSPVLAISQTNAIVDYYNLTVENHPPSSASTTSVVSIKGFGLAQIVNSTFRNNYGSRSTCPTTTNDICGVPSLSLTDLGTGFTYDSTAVTWIENTSFLNNYAPTGAAINSRLSGGLGAEGTIFNLTLINSQFINNTAATTGAALSISGPGLVSIINTSFDGNSAVQGAAIVSSNKCMLLCDRCNFTDNQAQQAAVFQATTDQLGNYSISFTRSLFRSNQATRFGAVFSFTSSAVSVYQVAVTDSTFVNNTAPFGAVAYLDSSGVDYALDIRRSMIAANVADRAGGAIYNAGAVFTSIANAWVENESRSGGAIYLTGTRQVFIQADTFQRNNAALSMGGAITLERDSIAYIDQTTFNGNSALQGGGIYTAGRVLIRQSVFQSNAARLGGGIYYAPPDVSLDGRLIVDALSTGEPSMDWLRQEFNRTNSALGVDTCANLEGVSFIANQADYSGAALMVDGFTNTCNDPCNALVTTGSSSSSSGTASLKLSDLNDYQTSRCLFSKNRASSQYGNNWALPGASMKLVYAQKSNLTFDLNAAYLAAINQIDNITSPAVSIPSLSIYPGLSMSLCIALLDSLNRIVTVTGGGSYGATLTLVANSSDPYFQLQGVPSTSVYNGLAFFPTMNFLVTPGSTVILSVNSDPTSTALHIPIEVASCPEGYIRDPQLQAYRCIVRPQFLDDDAVALSISPNKASLAFFVGCIGFWTSLILVEQVISARGRNRTAAGWLLLLSLIFSYGAVWAFCMIALDSISMSISVEFAVFEVMTGYVSVTILIGLSFWLISTVEAFKLKSAGGPTGRLNFLEQQQDKETPTASDIRPSYENSRISQAGSRHGAEDMDDEAHLTKFDNDNDKHTNSHGANLSTIPSNLGSPQPLSVLYPTGKSLKVHLSSKYQPANAMGEEDVPGAVPVSVSEGCETPSPAEPGSRLELRNVPSSANSEFLQPTSPSRYPLVTSENLSEGGINSANTRLTSAMMSNMVGSGSGSGSGNIPLPGSSTNSGTFDVGMADSKAHVKTAFNNPSSHPNFSRKGGSSIPLRPQTEFQWLMSALKFMSQWRVLLGSLLSFGALILVISLCIKSMILPAHIGVQFGPIVAALTVGFPLWTISITLFFFYFRPYRTLVALFGSAVLCLVFYLFASSLTATYHSHDASSDAIVDRSNLSAILFATALLGSFIALCINVYALRISRSHLTLALIANQNKLRASQQVSSQLNEQVTRLHAHLKTSNFVFPTSDLTAANIELAVALRLVRSENIRSDDRLMAIRIDTEQTISAAAPDVKGSDTSGLDVLRKLGLLDSHEFERRLSALNLEQLLSHPLTSELLKQHCAAQYNVESAMALLAIRQFEAEFGRNNTADRMDADFIYHRFIHTAASLQVNISEALRKTVTRQIEDGKYSRNMFSSVAKELEVLIINNNLSSFLASKEARASALILAVQARNQKKK